MNISPVRWFAIPKDTTYPTRGGPARAAGWWIFRVGLVPVVVIDVLLLLFGGVQTIPVVAGVTVAWLSSVGICLLAARNADRDDARRGS
jgi:hypothetical protein